MNVVIVGAGAVGVHLASLLSKGEHNVVLIDLNHERLERLSWQLDIATRTGSGTDWELLEALLAEQPDVFVALTNSDETNLVACSIAKLLGYPKTLARLREAKFSDSSRIDFSREFHLDYFLSPEIMVAQELRKHVLSPTSLALEIFAHGAIQMRTLKVPKTWAGEGTPIAALALPENVTVGLIKRANPSESSPITDSICIPHGADHILPGDEVTVIGETTAIGAIHKFFGVQGRAIESVTLIGATLVASHFAKMLVELGIGVKVIDPDRSACELFAERIPSATVIHNDPTDSEILRSEKVQTADLLVTCTQSDETNILTALLGRGIGCREAIVMLTNPHYATIANELELSHVVSPRVYAANRILSLVLSGRITSVISLYDDAAEVVEVHVGSHSEVTGIPLKELSSLFPRDFLVGVIENRGRTMVARGEHVISPRDKVIIITHPRNQHFLEEVF